MHTPVAPVGIKVGPVSAWLASLGLVPPITYSRMGDGQSNLTYLVTDALGQHRVLRRPPLGRLLPSAHDVVREHRLMAALVGTGLAPTPLALCQDPAVSDVPLLLMALVEGVVVDSREVAQRLPPAVRLVTGLSLAETLGEVHATDLAATGLTNLASPLPHAERQLRRWRRQWDGTGLRRLSRVHDFADRLSRVHDFADRLSRCVPPQRETGLVHGDYHLMNVVTSGTSGSVVAVLDWELCTLGDPVADLGGLLTYWPQEGEPGAPTDIPGLPGFPSQEQLIQRYAESTGRDTSTVGFWFALGCWKVAIIGEGVRSRLLRDARNTSRTARSTGEHVDAMLDRAERVADEYELPA